MSECFPSIRIDIEGVRHTLIQALNSSLEADKKAIERQVNEQLAAIDITRLVQEVVKQYAPRIVTDAVKQALERSVSQLLWEGPGRAALEALVLKGLARP